VNRNSQPPPAETTQKAPRPPARDGSSGNPLPEPPGQEGRNDVRDLPPHLRGAMRGDQGFVDAGGRAHRRMSGEARIRRDSDFGSSDGEPWPRFYTRA